VEDVSVSSLDSEKDWGVATREAAGLGRLLHQYRLAGGLTQEELAERAGVSARSVSDLERGLNRTPHPSTIRRLADALDLTPAQRTLFLASGSQERGGDPHPNLAEAVPTRKAVFVLPRLRVAAPAAVCLLALAVAGLFLALRTGGSSAGTVGVRSTAQVPVVLAAWGSPSGRPAAWGGELGAAVAGPNGTGYAVSFGTATTVLRFSASGEQLSSWTIAGTHGHPIGIHNGNVDAHGNLWLTTDDSYVREYSPDGRLLARWGGPGFNPGQFADPRGLGIASDGDVVVGDSGHHRIQILTPVGKPILQWAGPGNSPQSFAPLIIATDAQDHVYILDTGIWQIEKYTLQGKLLGIWHPPGLMKTNSFCGPDLGTDRHGHIYVLDCGPNWLRIDKLDSSGRELATWTSLGTHPRVSRHVTSIRFNDQGVGYVAVRGSQVVLKIDEAGHVLASWRVQQIRQPLLRSPKVVAADGSGNLYVTDWARNQVVKLSTGSDSVERWSVVVTRPPAAEAWPGLAVTPQGDIVLADVGRTRVDTYSSSGKLLSWWGEAGNATRQFLAPTGLGIDGRGDVTVLDVESGNTVARTFSPSGQFIRSWCANCNLPDLTLPTTTTEDSAGDVYVAFPTEIVKYSPRGLPLRSFEGGHSGPGHFFAAAGIAVDGHGNVYVTDPGDRTLQVFSSSRKLLAWWSRLGRDGPRFTNPGGVTVDARGDIYVIDGSRILELAPLVGP
jgi:transcriptional regulator with XRE-family HTH domain/DNA-binding beta-propeller fold protein YncE